MVKNIVILVVLGLLAVNTVSALKCYQCDDCKEKKAEDLKDCEEEKFPAPTEAPSSTVTVPATPSTVTVPSTPSTATDPATASTATDPATTSTAAVPPVPRQQSPNSYVLLNKYNRALKEVNTDLYCLSYTEDDKIYRGCTNRRCVNLESENEGLTKCKTCSTEGCNFGTNIQSWALSTVIAVVIVKYIL